MFGKDRFKAYAEARFASAHHRHPEQDPGDPGSSSPTHPAQEFGSPFPGNFGPRCGHPRGERHHGRHGGWGGFSGRGFGPGSDRERLFDSGELRLVILALVAEKASYGYEIIKAIEERLSGGYAPSPGVVYPTLTLLEEEGFATVSSVEGGKKLYTVTDAGRELLKTNDATIKAILGRMEQAGKAFGRGRSPQIMRAMANLVFALKMRAGQGNLNTDQVRKITEAIDAAARTIGEV